MADLNDVSAALVTLIAGALYPNGTGQVSAVTAPCYVYPGWPVADKLDADLRAGAVNVSVFPQPNIERVTTRYSRDWEDQTLATPTLTATVSGYTVTLGGTVTVGQYVTILVNTTAYSYAAQTGDTLTTMAAALADLIVVDRAGASSTGAVITLPATAEGLITTRVGAPGTVIRELKRQQRGFQITVWAPSNDLRAATAEAVDIALAATDFLAMPDLTQAWLLYRGQNDTDMQERAGEYRRDLLYWVEYATTQVEPGYPITAPTISVQGENAMGDLNSIVTTTS